MSVFKRQGALAPVLFGLVALVSLFVLDRAAAAVMGTLLLYSDDRAARIYAGGRADATAILIARDDLRAPDRRPSVVAQRKTLLKRISTTGL